LKVYKEALKEKKTDVGKLNMHKWYKKLILIILN
jgi:hypothetical protein